MLFVLGFSFPDRFSVPDWVQTSGFIPNFTVRGGFYFYPFRTSSDHAWNIHIGSDVSLYSNGNYNFGFTVDMELIADPNSPIFFQPRAIYFAEAFYISFQNLRIAYYHRCKHDIDNLKRTLILSGPKIFYKIEDMFIFGSVYPIRYDESYRGEPSLNLKSLFFSLGMFYEKRVANVLYKGVFQMDILNFSPKFNMHFELSYVFDGSKGRLKLPSVFEYFYETGMNEYTSPAKLLRIGISAQSF